MPDGALVSSYLQEAGEAVGMLGGLDDKPAEIKANGGEPPVTFPYSDYGVNQVGYCIVTTEDMLKNNPDLVKRFMAATVKSYKEARRIPMRLLHRWPISSAARWPRIRARRRRAVLDVTLGVLYSKANTEKKLGLNVPSDWEDMLALMKTTMIFRPTSQPLPLYQRLSALGDRPPPPAAPRPPSPKWGRMLGSKRPPPSPLWGGVGEGWRCAAPEGVAVE